MSKASRRPNREEIKAQRKKKGNSKSNCVRLSEPKG
jgi:hypothetical protein